MIMVADNDKVATPRVAIQIAANPNNASDPDNNNDTSNNRQIRGGYHNNQSKYYIIFHS